MKILKMVKMAVRSKKVILGFYLFIFILLFFEGAPVFVEGATVPWHSDAIAMQSKSALMRLLSISK